MTQLIELPAHTSHSIVELDGWCEVFAGKKLDVGEDSIRYIANANKDIFLWYEPTMLAHSLSCVFAAKALFANSCLFLTGIPLDHLNVFMKFARAVTVDEIDYLTLTTGLNGLRGKRYQADRNALNRFTRCAGGEVSEINGDKDALNRFLDEWSTKGIYIKSTEKRQKYTLETKFCKNIICKRNDNLDKYIFESNNSKGLLIVSCEGNTAFVHSMKVMGDMRLSVYIRSWIAKKYYQRRWINWGSCWNIASLRENKSHWSNLFLPTYTAQLF